MNNVNMRLLLEKNFAAGNAMPIIVHGDSMLPTLVDGEIIKVFQKQNITQGSIIVFYFKGVRLVHRVISIEGNVLYCKGDNARGVEKVYISDVVGVAQKIQ